MRANLKAQARLRGVSGDVGKGVELDSAFHLQFAEFLGNGEILRLTYQHRYAKLSDSKADLLRTIVDGKYETYFKAGATLKVRKEIPASPPFLYFLRRINVFGQAHPANPADSVPILRRWLRVGLR